LTGGLSPLEFTAIDRVLTVERVVVASTCLAHLRLEAPSRDGLSHWTVECPVFRARTTSGREIVVSKAAVNAAVRGDDKRLFRELYPDAQKEPR
jgi:hypothetical protein